METTAKKINILADGQETIVVIPVVLEPIQIEVPLVGIAPEIGNVPVAIPVLPDRAVSCPAPPEPPSFESHT